MGKQCLYDHSVRVPLIFAGPGIPEGKTSDDLVYLLDIFPTLCERVDLPVPDSVEGRSLVPGIQGCGSGSAPLYLAYADSIRGVTDGHHKLIEYACGATRQRLGRRFPPPRKTFLGKPRRPALKLLPS